MILFHLLYLISTTDW